MTSQAESFCRNRRLYDVRRGVVYLRRTDDLAQNQWRHFGTIPAIKTHVIRDIGITTRLSDATVTGSQGDASDNQNLTDSGGSINEVRGGDLRANVAASDAGQQEDKFMYSSKVLEERSTACPQISVTEVADSRGEASAEPQPIDEHAHLNVRSSLGDPNIVSLATPASVTTPHAGTTSMTWSEAGAGLQDSGCETRPLSFLPQKPLQQHSASKELQHSLLEAPYPYGLHHHDPEDGPALVFDTWGSRDWKVEDKLVPDPLPKNHAPKRYPPMSRAAGSGPGIGQKGAKPRRQLKTLTDFRSRNGTLRIIRPPAPVPVAKSHRQPRHHDADDSDEEFDVSTLGREKTYAMLKRIDRLLEPAKAFFVSDLTSSVREVRSSSPSSLSDLGDSLPGSDLDDQHLHPPSPGDRSRQAGGHVRVHKEDDFLRHFRCGPGDQLHPLGQHVQGRGEHVQLVSDRVSSFSPERLGEPRPEAEGLSHSHDGGFRQSTNVGGREIFREQHNPRLDAQVRRFLFGQPVNPGRTIASGMESSQQHRDDGGVPSRASQRNHQHHHYCPADDSLATSRVQRAGREVSRPGTLPPLQLEWVGQSREVRLLQSQRGQSFNNHSQGYLQHGEKGSNYTNLQRQRPFDRGQISSDYTCPQRQTKDYDRGHPQRGQISSDYTYPQRQTKNYDQDHPQRGQISSDYTYLQRQPKNHDQGHPQRQIQGPFCSEHDLRRDRLAGQGGKGKRGTKGRGKARGMEAGWLSGLVEGLETGVDMFAKCQDWVSKSFPDHSPRPAA